MEYWFQMVITIVCSVLASSGLWTFLSKRSDKMDAKTELLMGIAHDRIIFLGMSYTNRGYITQDEYENLYTYLYGPYKNVATKGNDSVDRVMNEVNKLPIRKAESAIMAKLEQQNKQL